MSDGSAKLKILFVDDEPQLLRMLRLTMLRMPEWDSYFAPSGDAALALMDEKSFDVVISDMRMPGMNGAQLLNETMKRHPGTFRIILTGHADEEVVMRSVGSIHQFLSKPCSLDTLRSTLERLRGLKRDLTLPEFQKTVAQITSLPSVPSLYRAMLEALADPDCSTETIGAIVAKDPGITAKMLQLVNSAFFGFSSRVSNPTEAVQLLGTGRIRSLTLSILVFSAFDELKFKALSVEKLWNHSLNTAFGAQQIAMLESADPTFVDQTFTAGMLHDVGKLILAENVSDKYLKIIERAQKEQRSIELVEREELGTSHSEIGAYLLGLWGLPVPLVAAVAWHHTPARDQFGGFSPLTTVHVADSIFNSGKALNCPGAPIDLEYLESIGVAGRLEDWKSALRAKEL